MNLKTICLMCVSFYAAGFVYCLADETNIVTKPYCPALKLRPYGIAKGDSFGTKDFLLTNGFLEIETNMFERNDVSLDVIKQLFQLDDEDLFPPISQMPGTISRNCRRGRQRLVISADSRKKIHDGNVSTPSEALFLSNLSFKAFIRMNIDTNFIYKSPEEYSVLFDKKRKDANKVQQNTR